MKTLRWSIPLAIFAILVAFLWVGLSRDPREVREQHRHHHHVHASFAGVGDHSEVYRE